MLLQPVNVTLIREGLRMTSYRPSLISKGSRLPVPMGPLRALQQIETVDTDEPFAIVPMDQALGSQVPPDDRMAAKVRWAEQAQYTILTREVPPTFAPYNAVIRVSERGTEDRHRDYLAHLVFEHDVIV
jgi:hypothetical protein